MNLQPMKSEPSDTPERSGWRALFDPDGPWVWLAFLPFYVFPWIFIAPTTFQAIASAIGLGVFLLVYLKAGSAKTGSVGPVVIITGIAMLLAPLEANWSVIAVYAAAMAGEIRPASRAKAVIALVCGIIAVTGLVLGHYPIWWGPAVLLSAIVGASNVSAANLRDKNSELRLAQEEVRALSRIAERERIGRDLHDLLGRTLTLIAVKADLTARLVSRDPDGALTEAREIGDAAREGLKEVREALAGVREAGLDREIGATRVMLESAGIGCRIIGNPASVSAERGGVLAMALREAITNVVRHSEATECEIRIETEGKEICLHIVDNGRGGVTREGGGLSGMRARLAAAGGGLALRDEPFGTRLVASVPAT